MTLHAAIDSFLAFKRALGMKYSAESRILRSFGRATGDIGLDAIRPETVRQFWRGSGALTQWHVRKHSVLRGFFQHWVAHGHIEASPMRETPPGVPRSFRPCIYAPQDLVRLLDATSIFHSDAHPLRRRTYRTLLLALFGAGLRPVEGLRLRLCDADLDDRLLFVRDTKLSRSRLVPIGKALAKALATYRQARQTLPMPAGELSRFFASSRGGAISLATLEAAWARLREHASVRNPPQARWQPRLHDLRHSCATHCLVTWYLEDADVTARLLWPATYLGHAGLSGTPAHRTMTPELLAEASRRFQRFATDDNADDEGGDTSSIDST